MGWRNLKKQEIGNTKGELVVAAPSPKKEMTGTWLGVGFSLEGKIHSSEELTIAGKVKGEIDCDRRITVTESGSIDGQVRCKSILIIGEVQGNIDAEEEIVIESTGRLLGDITTKRLTNKPGGFFEGYSHMIKDRTRTGRNPSPKAVPATRTEEKK